MKQIPPEKTRELLSRFGRCYPQEPKTPAQSALPEFILEFYREVGPANIEMYYYFMPSLENLVDENSRYLEHRRYYASLGGFGIFNGVSNERAEELLDETQIVFFGEPVDCRACPREHVVSFEDCLATDFQLEGSPGGCCLWYKELDMNLSTVAACIAVAETVRPEINPEGLGNEEKWFIEMDRQMSAISMDSTSWRDRLEDLFSWVIF